MDFAPAGMPTTQQIPGDCLLTVCDGGGKVTDKPYGDDAPQPDNQCLFGFCGADAQPHIEPKMAGEPCNQNGGTVCDGFGTCVA
jgi:hypothetical protein